MNERRNEWFRQQSDLLLPLSWQSRCAEYCWGIAQDSHEYRWLKAIEWKEKEELGKTRKVYVSFVLFNVWDKELIWYQSLKVATVTNGLRDSVMKISVCEMYGWK